MNPEQPRRRAERVEIRRSRELILAAAERHYAARSADPLMSELAVAAGVGNATLYRRFPSIPHVIDALYYRLVDHLQVVADDVLAQESGWDAVIALITGIANVMIEHPAIPRVTRKMVELHPDLVHGAQWDSSLKRVARRAQDEGMLRLDVDSNDLTLAAFRIGEYVYLPESARRRIIARQIAIVVDGLRADAARTPLPGTGIPTEEIQEYYRHDLP